MRSLRKALQRGAAASIVALALVAAGIAVLQSGWFSRYLRTRIVSRLEDATGGAVELAGFHFDWSTLTCQLRGLTIRGTEPATSPPLFTASEVSFRLPLLAALGRALTLGSVKISRPSVHLWLAADSKTNLPALRAQHTEGVSVDELVVSGGNLSVNGRELPVDVKTSKLSVLVNRLQGPPRYSIDVRSRRLAVMAHGNEIFDGSVTVVGAIAPNQAVVKSASLAGSGLDLALSGVLSNFAQPVVHGNADIRVSGPWAARLFSSQILRSGEVHLNGSFTYDRENSFSFSGDSALRQAIVSAGSFTSPAFDARGSVNATRDRAILRNVTAEFAGGALAGEVEIHDWKTAAFTGRLNRLALSRFRRALGSVAAGPMEAEVDLADPLRTLVLRTAVTLRAAPGEIPIQGKLQGEYVAAASRIAIRQADLSSGASTVHASGEVGRTLTLQIQSGNALELLHAATVLQPGLELGNHIAVTNASAFSFAGGVEGKPGFANISGNASLTNFALQGFKWSAGAVSFSASRNRVTFQNVSLRNEQQSLSGSGSASLRDWNLLPTSTFEARGALETGDLGRLAADLSFPALPIRRGHAKASFNLAGTLDRLNGTAVLSATNVDSRGELLNQFSVAAAFEGDSVRLSRGRIVAGPAEVEFTGTYRHAQGAWPDGWLEVRARSNGFPLQALSMVESRVPEMRGVASGSGTISMKLTAGKGTIESAQGQASVDGLRWKSLAFGRFHSTLATEGGVVRAVFTANGSSENLEGSVTLDENKREAVRGSLQGRIKPADLAEELGLPKAVRPLDGQLTGSLQYESSLSDLKHFRAYLDISTLALRTKVAGKGFDVSNTAPIQIDVSDGIAAIRSFHVQDSVGPIAASGTVALSQHGPVNVKVDGVLDLEGFENLQPDVSAGGQGVLHAQVTGVVDDPRIAGTLQIQDGSLAASNSENGITGVNGLIRFTGDRAVVERFSGQSGGGQVQAAGLITLSQPGILNYNLSATVRDVRLQPVSGVNITSNANLRLTGTSENGLLSGAVAVRKIVVDPQSDLADLMSSGRPVQAVSTGSDSGLSGLQLDIRISNSPNIQINTVLSRDISALIDLRLRGTPDRPVLLGSVTAEEGDVKVFGAKYSINHCQITFANTNRIEPVLDLDLQTVSRGITVDITISGTLNKLNFNYRSDPPLQPKDILALLTVGQPPSFTPTTAPSVESTNRTFGTLGTSPAKVLGQAISPGANRLSKLFGVTNIKLDPLVTGVTTNPQSRVTIEQQISTNVTVTYVTNLAQTSEQIFRFEWAFNPRYSIVAVRDDNGEFGIDLQYRRRF